MTKKETENRRMFLKHLVAGAATVAGGSIIVKPVKAGRIPQTQSEATESLYRETEDFKKYYENLRL